MNRSANPTAVPPAAPARDRRTAPPAAARVALALTVGAAALTACSSSGGGNAAGTAGSDVATVARAGVRTGGTLRWAVDAMPRTLNAFQADADEDTATVTGATLPAMFRLDAHGRPEARPRLPGQSLRHRPGPAAGRHLRPQPAGEVEQRPGHRRGRLHRPVEGARRQELRVLDGPQRRLRPDRLHRPGRRRPPGEGHLRHALRRLALAVHPALPQVGHRQRRQLQRRRQDEAAGQCRTLRGQGRGHRGRHRHPGPQPRVVGRPGQTRPDRAHRRAAGQARRRSSPRARWTSPRSNRARSARSPVPGASPSARPRTPPTPSSPSTAAPGRWPTSGYGTRWPAPSTARRSPRPSSSRSGCPTSRSATTWCCPRRPATTTTARRSAPATRSRRRRCSPTRAGSGRPPRPARRPRQGPQEGARRPRGRSPWSSPHGPRPRAARRSPCGSCSPRTRRPSTASAAGSPGCSPRSGSRTEISKVDDESYFQDHIAAGDFDLALYSWPGSAYPATDDTPDLRQAGARARRLADRRAELHPGRHRPDRPAADPGRRPSWTRPSRAA